MKKHELKVGEAYLMSHSIHWDTQAWADVQKAVVLDSEGWHKEYLGYNIVNPKPTPFNYAGEDIALDPSFVRGWSKQDFSGILCRLESMRFDGSTQVDYDIVHIRYLRALWARGIAKRDANLAELARKKSAARNEREAHITSILESLSLLRQAGVSIPYDGVSGKLEVSADELAQIAHAIERRLVTA